MQAALLGRHWMRWARDVGLRRLSYPKVPLNEALPQFAEGFARSAPTVASETHDAANVTQLQSGLTVASESAFGQFCAVGGESGLSLWLCRVAVCDPVHCMGARACVGGAYVDPRVYERSVCVWPYGL